MSSIIIASVPIHGHVTPLLAVARHLVERGDRVRFITGARFADAVTATGATYQPLPEGADFDDRDDLQERFAERARLKGAKAIAFDIEHVFVQPARPQYDAVMAAHAAEPASAVLTDPAFAGGAFVLGHPRTQRPAVVVCGVLPLSIASRDTAPYGLGLPPTRWLNQARNRALTAITRPIFKRRPAHRRSDVPRSPRRRACPTRCSTGPGTPMPSCSSPCRPSSIPGPMRRRRCTSPGRSAPPARRPRGPAWWSDLDSGRPVIHVTQGTIANKDFGQLVGPTLEALADDDVIVVVSTGGRPLDTLPPLPANARAAEYLPYDELLTRTDVFVTNGGYGGVQYALRYGVPIVATGGKEDKPEVGGRVVWSGVGRRIRREKPSPRALRRAIRRVLHDPRYRDASRRIAADMAAAPGLDGLTAIVDRLGSAATLSF